MSCYLHEIRHVILWLAVLHCGTLSRLQCILFRALFGRRVIAYMANCINGRPVSLNEADHTTHPPASNTHCDFPITVIFILESEMYMFHFSRIGKIRSIRKETMFENFINDPCILITRFSAHRNIHLPPNISISI